MTDRVDYILKNFKELERALLLMSTTVPLVFWGDKPPSHFVTCVTISPVGQEVATGCRSGFICLWSLRSHEPDRTSTDHSSGQIIPPLNTFQTHPRSLLVGASEHITALCYSQDGAMLFSAGYNGDIIRWDARDGACTHQTNLDGAHRGLKYLGPPQTHHLLLVYGSYCNAYLLDARTLDLAIILSSEEQPNWINAMLAIPLSLHQKETHVLGFTAEPLIKIWDVPRLDLQSPRESDSKEEDKSRHSDYISVQHITHWPKLIAQKLLIVGFSYFKVLGVRAKSQLPELCHVDCLGHVFSLSGGDFVDNEHIVVWSSMGSAHLYSFLPVGSEEKFEVRYLRCLQTDPAVQLSMDASWDLLHLDTKVLLVQGNVNGSLHTWELDLEVGGSEKSQPQPPKTSPHYTTSLERAWELLDKRSGLTSYLREVLLTYSSITPSHIPDDVMVLESSWMERDSGFANDIGISCILYLPELSKFVCGLTNGYVVILPLVKTLEKIVFGSSLRDSLVDDIIVLKAHRGRVSALLYPRQSSEQFNSKYVLTGGADGVVRVWDIENRLHLHCFMEHTGEVMKLKVCPKMTNTRLNCGVCSIGQDNSVAILSLSEFREVLLCANHSAAVTNVRWKPAEDLMLVRCKDGRVYIWQMDTGVLDRVIVGYLAEEIISNSYLGVFSGQRRDSLGVKTPKVNKSAQTNCKGIASIKSYRSHQFDPIIPAILIHMEPLIDQLCSSEQSTNNDKIVSKTGSSSQDLDLSSSPTRPSPYDRRQETVFFTRFLISCLHSWGMDSQLDSTCQEYLKIRLPVLFGMCPQYGLLSKYSCISLYLPGWGLEPDSLKAQDTPVSSFPLCYKWCLSPGLTTQHLLALTSLSYCCMNLYSKKQLRASSDETSQRKLTACSQLNTLTCVFLPEMLGHRFVPPHLSVLALKWPHHNGQIREAAQALLLAQLRSFSPRALQETVTHWYQFMPPQPLSPRNGVKGITYGNREAHCAKFSDSRSSKQEIPPINDYLSDPEALIKAKEYFTALIILSVIAAEFTDYGHEFVSTPSEGSYREVLSRQEMEHVSLSLQGILCCPQSSSCSLQGALRRTAAELIAKGFNFFCSYLDVPSVLMSLFEITVTHPVNTVEEPMSVDYQLARSIAMRALTNVFLARADEMIDVLSKEVGTYTQFIGSTHSLIPVPGHEHQEPDIAAGISKTGLHLLPRSRKILLKILEDLLKKRLPHVFLKIVEFMQLVIFCVGSDELRSRKIEEVFPSIDKLGCYAQCVRTNNLAVGRKSGYIGLFDLKHNKLQEFVGHSSPVTCLTFSIEGKYLCSYSQGSSEMRLWHVSTPPPILGQMVNPTVRLVKTVLAVTPSDSHPLPPYMGYNNFRLFWLPKSKASVLLLGDNPKTELEFSF